VIALVIAAQVTLGPIAPPVTLLRPVGAALKLPIIGPSVLLPQLKGPAPKGPRAHRTCAPSSAHEVGRWYGHVPYHDHACRRYYSGLQQSALECELS
jgi:hypothetical protein